MLDNLFGPVEHTAEYLYQRGATVAAMGGNPTEVVALLRAGGRGRPHHPGALFGLALENDRYGNDDTAMDLYERSVARFPAHVGSLLNLGLLYEDRQQYEQAAAVLPAHAGYLSRSRRARPVLQRPEASRDMFYDDDAMKKRDRMGQVLGIPVTDFELSVRSRNCLQKMGVNTLGDLARTSEADLLASKNFGETSLVEIKRNDGLQGPALGQLAAERPATEASTSRSRCRPTNRPCSIEADRRPEPLRACPQVHDPPGHQHDRRTGPPHGRRPAGVQELRRDQPERSPREADGQG